MYHTPDWYAHLRDVGMLWQALGGVAVMWTTLPKRSHYRILFMLYWLLGAAAFLVCRRYGLLFLEQGSNVYFVYLFAVGFVLACCRVKPSTALMFGSSGFLAQQICGSLELALRSIPAVGAAFDYSSWIVVLDTVFYGAGYYLLWRVFRDKTFHENEDTSPVQAGAFSALALLFCLGFYTVNQYIRGWASFTPIELTLNALYTAIGGIFLMVMQFEIIRRQRLNTELQEMKTLLHVQETQWQQGRERAELVNEKYHDLKKIVNSFRGELDGRMLSKLSDAIDAYDDQVKTGSSAADVVLTEARELCRGRGIQFTCYVNGSDLEFMEELDIYAFLKNTMDNAVEAVERVSAGQDKFISLTLRNEGGIVTLHEENPCGHVEFENGLPQSRRDSDYHGYGMKSMLRIANKYGGAVTASEKGGIFYLDAIFMP